MSEPKAPFTPAVPTTGGQTTAHNCFHRPQASSGTPRWHGDSSHAHPCAHSAHSAATGQWRPLPSTRANTGSPRGAAQSQDSSHSHGEPKSTRAPPGPGRTVCGVLDRCARQVPGPHTHEEAGSRLNPTLPGAPQRSGPGPATFKLCISSCLLGQAVCSEDTGGTGWPLFTHQARRLRGSPTCRAMAGSHEAYGSLATGPGR